MIKLKCEKENRKKKTNTKNSCGNIFFGKKIVLKEKEYGEIFNDLDLNSQTTDQQPEKR